MVIQITREVARLVVFDAPAYRRLVGRRHTPKATELFDGLSREERKLGLQPIAYSTVLLDLLAPLADPDGDDYENRKAAAIAAIRHCRIPRKNGGEDVAVWASSGLQLCLSLFHRWPEELLETDDLVRTVVDRIAEDPEEETIEACRDDLGTIRDRARAWRSSFAEALEEHLETPLSAETVAQAHVRRAEAHVSVELSDRELERKAAWLARKFEVTVRMYRQILEKAREDGDTLTSERTADLLWNLQVVFMVGETHKLDGNPATVVSGDDEIVDAAEACGLGGKIVSVLRYGDFRERIEAA